MDCGCFAMTFTVFQRAYRRLLPVRLHRIDLSVAQDYISDIIDYRTTGRVMDIPVGREMLGRVVNPLGQPIDGLGPINTSHRRPIEFKAPGIMERRPVCEPVQTGLLAVDAMVPIGSPGLHK